MSNGLSYPDTTNGLECIAKGAANEPPILAETTTIRADVEMPKALAKKVRKVFLQKDASKKSGKSQCKQISYLHKSA